MHGWCVCVLEGMADIWDHADLVCPVGLLVISHLLTFKSNHLGLQSHFLCVCVCACVFAGRDVFNCLRSAGVRNRLYPTALWWRLSKGPDAVWILSKDLRGLECRNWTSAHTEELCVRLCVDYRRLRVQYTSAILNVPMLSITFWLSKGSGWSFLSCCFWLFICYLIFSNLSSGLLRQMEPGFKAGQIYFIKLVAVHPLALWKTSRRLTEKSDLSFFGLIKIRLTSRSDLYDHRHTGCVKYFIRQKYFSYKEHWFFSNRARI